MQKELKTSKDIISAPLKGFKPRLNRKKEALYE
jgi:hypothetical protein